LTCDLLEGDVDVNS